MCFFYRQCQSRDSATLLGHEGCPTRLDCIYKTACSALSVREERKECTRRTHPTATFVSDLFTFSLATKPVRVECDEGLMAERVSTVAVLRLHDGARVLISRGCAQMVVVGRRRDQGLNRNCFEASRPARSRSTAHLLTALHSGLYLAV